MQAPDRRVVRLPLAIHAVVLLFVLLLAGAYVGSASSFIPDEGALIIQARMLARGDGWIEHPHLLGEVDPTGAWYPLDLTARVPNGGFAPLAQHPVYSLIAAGLYRLGRVKAIIAVSALGGWAAALVGAAISKRFDKRLAIPVLWVIGLVSPLFFDSFLAEGHSIGAALCGGATLATISMGMVDGSGRRGHRGKSASRPSLIGPLTVGLCLFCAALVRNEAVIFALALGLVAFAYSIRLRRPQLVACGSAAFLGAYAARWVERATQARVLGGKASRPISLVVTNGGQSFIGARISGFIHTWLEPSHLPAVGGDLLLLALFAVIPLLVVAATTSQNGGVVTVLAVAVVGTAFARLLVHPYVAIPGLLLAFPLLWAGAWVVRPKSFVGKPMFCFLVVVLFIGGVVLSQPPQGGELEWGGRYFALGLPVLVPLVMLAFVRIPWNLSRRARVAVIASGTSVSLVFGLLAVVSLHHEKADNFHVGSEIDRMSEGQATRPVIISVVPWLGRLSWSIYDKTEMLYVPPKDLGTASQRLRNSGLRSLTFVSFTNTDYATFMTGWTRVSTERFSAKARYWTVDRLVADGPAG